MKPKILSKKDRLLGCKDVEGNKLSLGDRVLLSKGFTEAVLINWWDSNYLWAKILKPIPVDRWSDYVKRETKCIRVSPSKCIKPEKQKLPELLEKCRQSAIEKDEDEEE